MALSGRTVRRSAGRDEQSGTSPVAAADQTGSGAERTLRRSPMLAISTLASNNRYSGTVSTGA